ncbi:hypothetical protein JHD48_09710 [Sulfurimonas sp. SAG-AH-194-I05]|nr:hypothetical protein [Sulfurimonas sp. SAG-AH-194-I05]MDF1876011.1 hypothetical protein [Sulfurimonas sp. SAG-AH-194-I05]
MKIDIILLSGTPASGKDSITNNLIEFDNRFVHFKKHKIATGGKMDDTYYLIPKEEFDNMAQNNKFVQYHYRYDRGYGVSLEELKKLKHIGKIPVIHVGKYENIQKFRDFGLKNLLSVLIHTDRKTTLERLQVRHVNDSNEVEKRITAYDEEIKQLCETLDEKKILDFDLLISNNLDNISNISNELYEKITYKEKNCTSIEDILIC